MNAPDPIPFPARDHEYEASTEFAGRMCCDGLCEKGQNCPHFLPTGEARPIDFAALRRQADADDEYDMQVQSEVGSGALPMIAGLVIGGLLGIFSRELIEELVRPALMAMGVL